MVGIQAFACYLPMYRLKRWTVFQAMGWFNPVTLTAAQGEKAVANHDEDSLTMAVAAGMNCLQGVEREDVDALYLASTTLPYLQREGAAILSAALNLKPEIRSMDFRDSLKCGTSAVLAAMDALRSEAAEKVLVCASDSRLGKLGSMQEHFYGDGAAALLLGNQDVVAEFKGAFSLSADFPDYVRAEGKSFDRSWEERWITSEGYGKFIPEVIAGLLQKYGLDITNFAKVIYPCHFKRAHLSIAKRLGLKEGQLQDNLHETVGDTGCAHPLLMLVAALEEANPGDKLLVVSYGNGADALYFEVTEAIQSHRTIRGYGYYSDRKRELQSYEKYTVFKRLVPVDLGFRGEIEPGTAFSMLWRKRKAVLGLVGSRCKACGTPQYPPQRVCANPQCGVVDQMEDYPFAHRRGTIFTYTGDMLASSYDPPAVYGLLDMEGGGRLFLDFTDCDLQSLKVGDPVEMTFRRKYLDEHRGIHGYFWKAMPL
jgi:3-hydroxy-3-methylglutaryl CoA synthase